LQARCLHHEKPTKGDKQWQHELDQRYGKALSKRAGEQ
jgi:hypothetical protein